MISLFVAVEDDPYKEDEKDPVKSEAIRSQLWEVKLLQHHYMEKVAKTANLINKDLPSVEYPLEPLLELTWDKVCTFSINQAKYNFKSSPSLSTSHH